MSKVTRRRFMQTAATVAGVSMMPSILRAQSAGVTADAVRQGILHSLTGTFAIAEAAMVTRKSSPLMRLTPVAACWAARSLLMLRTVPVRPRCLPKRRWFYCVATRWWRSLVAIRPRCAKSCCRRSIRQRDCCIIRPITKVRKPTNAACIPRKRRRSR